MAKKKKTPHDARVKRICSHAIDRIQIGIFGLDSVFRKAEEAVARGENDETAIASVREFALSIGKATD